MNTTKGIESARPNKQQEQIAVAGGADGQHVVDAHAHVRHDDDPERLPDASALAVLTLLLGAFGEQLDRDPDDHRPPDKFDELHVQQLGHQKRADDPDDDGTARPQDNPPQALFCPAGS